MIFIMNSTARQMRDYRGRAFFSFGFRPFFLGGAVVAALAPFVTALAFSGAIVVGEPYGVIAYHAHEMIFGYLGAVVTGFILTAVPNWTGRLPVMGTHLAALFSLWVIGRIAMGASSAIGVHSAALLDALFLCVVFGIVCREVVAGKNWRNAPVCIALGGLACGNILWHVGVLFGENSQFGFRLGVAVIALLLGLIGGRITPSFTRNWLAKTGRETFDVSVSLVDKAALGMLGLALIAWLATPGNRIAGLMLIAAALFHVVWLMRWRGWRTMAEPLVVILHVGYIWLPVSLLLLGVSVIDPGLIAPSTAIHALTAGAAGVMTLAVMTRATLGHTGRALTAGGATVLLYVFVNSGAAARLAAPIYPEYYGYALIGASVLWGMAFLLFAIIYGRYLVTPKCVAE